MQNDILVSLPRLSDADLVSRLKSLLARERDATGQLVAHLAELDTRDVHLREGYASLFVYCRDALGFSEWEAYNRIEVARAARRFPVILEMLADGAVHLTAVRLLAPHLTAENHGEVLAAARGRKKSEIKELVASLSPRPDVPPTVRKLPATGGPASSAIAPPPATEVLFVAAPSPAALELIDSPKPPAAVLPSPAPAAVTPLSPDRYKLQLTIAGETLEKLRLAKDMLGHTVPSGDDATVIDRALTVLLVELAKAKYAQTDNPRPSRGKNPRARSVAASVKRTVWVRDLGRCAFVGTNGHRCHERRFVEFHHVDPYVLGGEASVDKIELRCRRHNDYEGRLYFGTRRRETGALEPPMPLQSQPPDDSNLFRNKLARSAPVPTLPVPTLPPQGSSAIRT
jgi:hypothetical protein